jgi:DNA-binding response OmpR family regulator
MSAPILLIDEDPAIRQLVDTTLSDEGYDVVTAGDGQSALSLLHDQGASLILLNSAPWQSGDERFVESYRRLPGPHAPIVLFSASPQAAKRAALLAVEGVLIKPYDMQDLLSVAERYSQRT